MLSSSGISSLSVVALLSGIVPPQLRTQQPADTTRRLDFSSVLFANFQYRGGRGAGAANRFDLERAYLTFRLPAGERANVRLTADVFQQTVTPDDAYYRGWTFRAKYAYLQYDFLRPSAQYGTGAFGRLGMLQTVVIEHIETFWPRWIARSAVETFGFFASADVGAAAQLTLPGRIGEMYATVTNGPGYTSREADRFKDYAARISLTPLAGGRGIARSLTLTGWGYQGALGSRFTAGGPGQVGPVGSSLRRNRWGAFAGLRDPRLILGAEYGVRSDEGESGANTPAAPRVVVDSTGRLLSGFALVQPFTLLDTASRVPLTVLVRVDRFEPDIDTEGTTRFVIAGLVWPLTRRASIALDYQEQLPRGGATSAVSKTYFLHAVASF
jgi:hypothetical protein